MTRVAVITLVHGRHDHLRMQHRGLAAGEVLPDDYIVVAMDDEDLEHWSPPGAPQPFVVRIASHPLGLPLAAARNLGARVALERGAEVLVFLDVDCIPSGMLVAGYRDAADDGRTEGTLLCGPVAYLPPRPSAGYALESLEQLAPPHPARPAPAHGEVELGGEHRLFWSLSFALTADTWHALGGFCTEYIGYGGEDTDFARTAAEQGIDLAWVGSARAYHQHHPVESPPVRHLDDILRNGTTFVRRWGEWPMTGWLEEFERMGLVRREGSDWRRVDKDTGREAGESGGDDENRTRVISLED